MDNTEAAAVRQHYLDDYYGVLLNTRHEKEEATKAWLRAKTQSDSEVKPDAREDRQSDCDG
jgi:hypothetical protein